MDYAANDEPNDIEIIDIRGLKRKQQSQPVLRVTTNALTLAGPMKVSPKSKKLKLSFKHNKTSPPIATRNLRSNSKDPSDDADVELPSAGVEDNDLRLFTTSFKSTDVYQEFGDCINGYKFVKPKRIPVTIDKNALRHSIFTEDKYPVSFEPIEIIEPRDKYAIDYNNVEIEGQTYEEYVKKWGTTPTTIAWPNSFNSFAKLSSDSIRDFFKDEKKVWKLERIRWHPDNLSKKLSLSNDLELISKITKVFQLINEVWEREFEMK